MGCCSVKVAKYEEPTGLNKSNFRFDYPIGKGGFGRVWKVKSFITKEELAMKVMLKSRVIQRKSVSSVVNEYKILSRVSHPFIVNMHYAFQDRERLYLAMDLLTGGDLRYYLTKKFRFNEQQSKFIIACILTALEYLHENRIMHRDIKPENLVFDRQGYLCLTDFGVARYCAEENSKETSGTPGYMAPEVLCKQNHSTEADYFAVGVIGYELMMHKRPYRGQNRKEIRDFILSKQVQISQSEVPSDWSFEAAELFNSLLQRRPQNRLGYNGTWEVMNHPWFKNLSWEKLVNRSLSPPFVPPDSENFNEKYTVSSWKDNTRLKLEQFQHLFKGYYYDKRTPGISLPTKVSSY